MPEKHSSHPGKKNKPWLEKQFVPHPLLSNQHLMTIVPGFLPRRLDKFRHAGIPRWFELNAENKLLGYCHWQADKRKPTVILLHGLEGSSESSHVLGIGFKAFSSGFNVLRLNMRNCGGSMSEARSLYNAGMWEDLHFVMQSLQKDDGLDDFILAGYSLGGNLILNTAAHHQNDWGYRIRAVCTVSPSIDLAHAVEAIELPHNRMYQDWFLRSMKARILAKCKQFPDVYDSAPLKEISTIRDFDERFTAPHGGYGTAERYYREASSLSRLQQINVPVFMLASEDDPLVPIDTFQQIKMSCPQIELLITKNGGHGGFFQSRKEAESGFDHYWAENRVVDYMREVNRD